MKKLSVVVFLDHEVFIAQCLEHDLCTQGTSLQEVKESFARVKNGHRQVAMMLRQEPWISLQKAPQRYWDLFDETTDRTTEEIDGEEITWGVHD